MALFDDFLHRNQAALVATYTTILSAQGAQVGEVYFTTAQLLDFFVRLILTEADLRDPVLQKAIEQARMLKMSQAGVRLRLEAFVAALRENCRTDSTLDATQQKHVARMIDQSERFLLNALLPTLKLGENAP